MESKGPFVVMKINDWKRSLELLFFYTPGIFFSAQLVQYCNRYHVHFYKCLVHENTVA